MSDRNSDVAGDARRMAARAELLKRRLKGSGEGASAIPRRPPSEPVPASAAQQRLYFLSRLNRESAAYHMNAAYHLRGELDEARLEQALNGLVENHEVLRTRFELTEERLLQRCDDFADVDLERLDPPQERDWASIHDELVAFVRRPIDLETGALFRAALMTLATDEHWLLIVVHHAVADEWSMGLMLEELGRRYSGEAVPSPALQYGDYAHWEQNRLASLEELHLPFWRERLEGAGEGPLLAGDRNGTLNDDSAAQGVLLHRELQGVAPVLAQLARSQGATPFMAAMTAFSIFLYRWTEQDDVILGTPAANRERAELEAVTGLFINSIVIRNRMDGSMTFRETLESVAGSAREAFARQSLPFDTLVQALDVPRDARRNPLFQIMLVEETEPPGAETFADLEVERRQLDTGTAKLDLTCFVRFDDDSLYVAMEADLGRYSTGFTSCLLDAFAVLLEGVCADPDRVIDDLPLVSDTQRQVLLGLPQPLPELLETPLLRDQVFLRSNASDQALRLGDVTMSYAELCAGARRMAGALDACGVRPGQLVPILAGTSPRAIQGMLAVWCLGAAYVPLDPAYPATRILAMLEVLRASEQMAEVMLVESAEILSEAGASAGLSALNMLTLDQAVLEPPRARTDLYRLPILLT